MPRVIFTRTARTELTEAQDWYEDESPGLGLDFLAAAAKAILRLRESTQQFPVVYKNIRRALLNRFPYALFFVIEAEGTLTVIACFHASRNPKHWQSRI